MNGLTVKVANTLTSVAKMLVLVKGRRATKSKLEILPGDGGRRVVTLDVQCPFWDAAPEHLPTYDLIGHCTEDTMLDYKIDAQTALVSVVQATSHRGAPGAKNKLELIVDAVYPVPSADATAHAEAWKGYIDLSRNVPVPTGETLAEIKDVSPRKCRKLENHPTDTSVSNLHE